MTSGVIAARPARRYPSGMTTTADMTSIHAIVERYLELFNGDDPSIRAAAIRGLFVAEPRYTDPSVALRGVHALAGFVADLRARWPGGRFALAGPIDAHHDRARFRWDVTMPGAARPLAVGFDVITLVDGRIRDVYGFIDHGRGHDLRAVVERYLECWNELDAERRRRALAEVFVEDCTYVDPLVAVQGIDALSEVIGAVQGQLAGLRLVPGDQFDAHHDQARFTWHAMAPGGTEPVVIGFDVAVFEGDRIREVHGFIDRMPGAH